MIGEWQNIKTAPRDGSGFLAYNPMVGVYNTALVTSWETDNDGYEGFPCGLWAPCLGKWDCVPTHWMSLPPPPTEQG